MRHTRLFGLLLMCFMAYSIAIPVQIQAQASATNQTEILWDTWGVPHIYADDEAGLYHAFGWAQMHNHGNLIARLYGQGRGRAAAYWGRNYLATDRLVHMLDLPGMAAKAMEKLPPEEYDLLQSFTDGMNAYVKAHPDRIEAPLHQVFPLSPTDIISHAYRVFFLEFLTRGVIGQSQRWPAGSNAWAVAPAKSVSGNAMLLMNPHLAWSDHYMFMEASLNTPGFNLYGATLVGMPFFGMGFNEYMGWTHTVNTIDNTDLFQLRVSGDSYFMDGRFHSFEKRQIELSIQNQDGSIETETLLIKHSAHGVVVNESDNQALALRFARMDDPPMIIRQWYNMGKARSLSEFENALRLNVIPLFNTIYADKEGNILYHFGGLNPKKAFGDWDTWSSIVPGDEAASIWKEYHAYEELPRLINPSSGWLQNANDPPFTSTVPPLLKPEDFPAYLAPNYMNFRAQQSVQLLLEQDKIDFDTFTRLQRSSRVLMADRLLDDFLGMRALTSDSLTLAAFDVLESWNRTMEADAQGAILFILWLQRLAGHNMLTIFEHPWDFDSPHTTPYGIADPGKAVLSLTEVAKNMVNTHGKLNPEYGSVYRMRMGDYDVPASGGSGNMGNFRVVGFRPVSGGTFQAVSGESFTAMIEFSDPPRARVLLTYGNASQPGSPHVGDQLPLFSRQELREAWLTREAVERNLFRRETIRVRE